MKKVQIILSVFLAVFVAGNQAVAQKETPKKNLVKEEKLDRSKRPVAGPAPEIKMGEAKSFTLPNGLKVFVVENHKIPRVSFSVNFDVDPFTSGDKKGFVDFTGELLGT